MKTDTKSNSGLLSRPFAALLFAAVVVALCLIPVTARAQIFVTNPGNNTIGEYNATTRPTTNLSFSSSVVSVREGLVSSGANMFVTNAGNTTIGAYNATAGATINPAFISGVNSPNGIAVSGGNLFVTNAFNNTIGEYNATTGATINPSFISSGLNVPVGIAISSPSSVSDASPTLPLLLLGLGATFGLNLLLHRRSEA